MKAWRMRSSSGGGTPPSSAVLVAHVVSVVTDDGSTVVWNFDRVVTAIGDPTGLVVGGENMPAPSSGLGTMSITFSTIASHDPGEVWSLTAVTAAIVFSPVATIADATGLTS